MENISNLNEFNSLAIKFEKTIMFSERKEHLEKMKNLFLEISDPGEKKQAADIIKEKVFNHIDSDDFLMRSDKSIKECISAIIKEDPENLKDSFLVKKDSLTVEDFQAFEILDSNQNVEEKIRVLEKLAEKQKKEPSSVTIGKIPVYDLILKTSDPDLIKYLFSLKGFQEILKEDPYLFLMINGDNPEITLMFVRFFIDEKISLVGTGINANFAEKIINSKLKEEDKITILEIIFEKHDINENPKANYLFGAIYAQEEKLIDFLLVKGVDINRQEHLYKEPPVWVALKNKDYKTFEKLLIKNVDLTALSFDNEHEINILDYILNKPEHLEAARLLNHYQPEIITPLLSQGDMNILLKFKARRKTQYKEKIKPYKQFQSLKDQANLEMKVKHISHTLSMKGHSPIVSQKEEKKINLEGLFSYKFYKNITRTITTGLMTLDKGSIILSEEDEMMRNTYNIAIDALSFASKNPTASDLKKRFEGGKWAIVYTGYKGHAVTVLLKKGDKKKNEPSRLIICNRGNAMVTPVQSFAFNAEDLTTEDIQAMMDKKNNAKDYKDFFFETLPKKLNLKRRKEEKILDEVCRLEKQTVGNCSYASAEMATKTMVMDETINRKHPKGFLEKKESLEKTVSEISKDFEVLRSLAQIQSIRDYLELFKSQDFRYKLDPFLVGKALALLWSSPMDSIEVKKELQLLEGEYFEIVKEQYGKEALLDYKSEKIFQLSLQHRKSLSQDDAIKTQWDKVIKAYDILITNYQLATGKDSEEMIKKMEKDFTDLVSDLNSIKAFSAFKNYRLNRIENRLVQLIHSYTIQ